jgi:hypothetical protein
LINLTKQSSWTQIDYRYSADFYLLFFQYVFWNKIQIAALTYVPQTSQIEHFSKLNFTFYIYNADPIKSHWKHVLLKNQANDITVLMIDWHIISVRLLIFCNTVHIPYTFMFQNYVRLVDKVFRLSLLGFG